MRGERWWSWLSALGSRGIITRGSPIQRTPTTNKSQAQDGTTPTDTHSHVGFHTMGTTMSNNSGRVSGITVGFLINTNSVDMEIWQLQEKDLLWRNAILYSSKPFRTNLAVVVYGDLAVNYEWNPIWRQQWIWSVLHWMFMCEWAKSWVSGSLQHDNLTRNNSLDISPGV